MDKKQEFWNVFTETGRVDDYLRYCKCAAQEEARENEAKDRRTDHPGDTGRRSG